MGKKITELNTRTNLLNTDFLPVAIEGETFKTPIQSIKNKLLLENNTYTGNNIFTGENIINNIDFNDKSTKIVNSNFVKTNLSPKCQIVSLDYVFDKENFLLTLKAGSIFSMAHGVNNGGKNSWIGTLNTDESNRQNDPSKIWYIKGDTSNIENMDALIFLIFLGGSYILIMFPKEAFLLNNESFGEFLDKEFYLRKNGGMEKQNFPFFNINLNSNFFEDFDIERNDLRFCFLGELKYKFYGMVYLYGEEYSRYDIDDINIFNGNFYEMDALYLKKIFEKNKKYVPDIKKPIINIPLTDTGQVKMMPEDGILCMSATFGSNGGYIKMIYCDAEGDPLDEDMGGGDHFNSSFKAIASITVAKGQYIRCVYDHNNIVGSPTLKLLQF